MARTFRYSFTPPEKDPAPGPSVDLAPEEIEDAGIREVLQTPAVPYGSWSILSTLLAPTGDGTPFVFREPLGQAREIKVALSGLFGRFVARAYLERYFRLSIFAHLGNTSLLLDGRKRVTIQRLSRGDLPDWVAADSQLSNLTVAEAKGCHSARGPGQALSRAWKQAGRIDIVVGQRKATVKRIAVATRWGALRTSSPDSWLSVIDPTDEGDALGQDEQDSLFVGLLRLHIANLIRPLGHDSLADALRLMTREGRPRRYEREVVEARRLLDDTPIREISPIDVAGGLIGGFVTRAGPLAGAVPSTIEQASLERLDLRPVFVGVERDLVDAAIEGDAQRVRTRLVNSAIEGDAQRVRARLVDARARGILARADRAGGWIVPLGVQQRIVAVGT